MVFSLWVSAGLTLALVGIAQAAPAPAEQNGCLPVTSTVTVTAACSSSAGSVSHTTHTETKTIQGTATIFSTLTKTHSRTKEVSLSTVTIISTYTKTHSPPPENASPSTVTITQTHAASPPPADATEVSPVGYGNGEQTTGAVEGYGSGEQTTWATETKTKKLTKHSTVVKTYGGKSSTEASPVVVTVTETKATTFVKQSPSRSPDIPDSYGPPAESVPTYGVPSSPAAAPYPLESNGTYSASTSGASSSTPVSPGHHSTWLPPHLPSKFSPYLPVRTGTGSSYYGGHGHHTTHHSRHHASDVSTARHSHSSEESRHHHESSSSERHPHLPPVYGTKESHVPYSTGHVVASPEHPKPYSTGSASASEQHQQSWGNFYPSGSSYVPLKSSPTWDSHGGPTPKPYSSETKSTPVAAEAPTSSSRSHARSSSGSKAYSDMSKSSAGTESMTHIERHSRSTSPSSSFSTSSTSSKPHGYDMPSSAPHTTPTPSSVPGYGHMTPNAPQTDSYPIGSDKDNCTDGATPSMSSTPTAPGYGAHGYSKRFDDGDPVWVRRSDDSATNDGADDEWTNEKPWASKPHEAAWPTRGRVVAGLHEHGQDHVPITMTTRAKPTVTPALKKRDTSTSSVSIGPGAVAEGIASGLTVVFTTSGPSSAVGGWWKREDATDSLGSTLTFPTSTTMTNAANDASLLSWHQKVINADENQDAQITPPPTAVPAKLAKRIDVVSGECYFYVSGVSVKSWPANGGSCW